MVSIEWVYKILHMQAQLLSVENDENILKLKKNK